MGQDLLSSGVVDGHVLAHCGFSGAVTLGLMSPRVLSMVRFALAQDVNAFQCGEWGGG